MPMSWLLSGSVGLFAAVAFYSLLRRSMVRMVFGFVMLSNAINLLIFGSGHLERAAAPIVGGGHGDGSSHVPAHVVANPLPQALILTAIVISFGLTAFILTLALRAFWSLGTTDTEVFESGDPNVDVEGTVREGSWTP